MDLSVLQQIFESCQGYEWVQSTDGVFRLMFFSSDYRTEALERLIKLCFGKEYQKEPSLYIEADIQFVCSHQTDEEAAFLSWLETHSW